MIMGANENESRPVALSSITMLFVVGKPTAISFNTRIRPGCKRQSANNHTRV